MNRIWVSLWLGIMGAFVGLLLSFELAQAVTALAGTVFRGLGENETALLICGNLGGIFLSVLFAAFIAWRLARPLSEVSRAARQVSGGDLSVRAQFPSGRWRLGPWSRRNGEVTRLLDDFNAMAASLERLESERQATTAATAHELRTPLAVLQARLTALQDGVFALDLAEVSLLVQQTDLLARLVEDLRNLSLADAGELELTFAPCDLAALVRDAAAGFETRARTKGVRLEVCTEGAPLQGDAARLRQVVTNLLDNALKFTPQGGCITATVKTEAAGVRLTVQDTGSGIAAGVKARVFERFYHPSDDASGSG